MLPTIKELRAAAGGLENLTDEEIISATYPAYQQYYGSVDEFAKSVGYGGAGRGMASSRISAGIDNYQAGLLGLGGAASRAVGLDGAAQWFDQRRDANEQAAAYATQRARDLGAVDDWREVDGVGSGLNYLGGLAAQSLPYLGEAVVGGLAARGLATGARAALRGATTAEEAAAAGRRLGAIQTGGAVAASYPSAVGDILANQREAGGEDLGSALLGGVPYAALNAFGVEGLAARGLRPFAAGEGRLARMATGAASTAIGEGLGETGQELANQYFGHMAVDPNETLFNDEANRRYLDSFVGGAALGGLFGGAGGFRRPRTVDEGQFDLTGRDQPQGDSLQLGFSPLAGTPVVFPDGTVALNGEQELEARYGVGSPAATIPDMGETPVVSTQQEGKTPTTPGISQFDEVDQGLTDMGIAMASGKKTREKQRAFYQDAVATGIPLDSDLLTPYWTAVSQNRFGDRTKVLLQNAIVQAKKEAANVSQPSAPAGQPVGSGDGRSAAPVGSMGNPGSVPTGQQPVGGNAGNPQPAGGQVAPVANAGVQRPAAVAPVGENTSILAGANEPASPANLDYVEDQNALEIARLTGQGGVAEALEQDATGQRADRETATAEDAERILGKFFEESPTAERDRQIFDAWLTATRPAGRGVKGKINAAIGKDFDVGTKRVEQITNTKKLVETGKALGYSEEQVYEAFGLTPPNTKAVDPNAAVNPEVAALRRAIEDLGARAKAAKGAEKIELEAQRKELQGVLSGMAESRSNEERGVVARALANAGFTIEEGDTTGWSLDDNREWQRESSSGNQEGDVLLRFGKQIDDLRSAIETLESQGLGSAAAELEELSTKVATELEAAKAALQATKVPAAPKREVSADLAAAKQKFKDVGRDVTKMEPEELRMLRGEAERFKNKELLAKIDAQLGAAPVAPAVEAEAAPTAEAQTQERERFPYPPTLPGAPAYVEPAQRAVVDFMNGDLTREQLRERFAELGMTVAQQRSVTNPIEWFPADFDAVKELIDAKKGAPKQDSGQTLWESLRAQTPDLVTYEELTGNERGYLTELADRTNGKPTIKNELGLQELMGRTTDAPPFVRQSRSRYRSADQFGNQFESVEASLEELTGHYPSVNVAITRLRGMGVGNTLDAVQSWQVTLDPVSWDAIYTVMDGKPTVVLSHDAMKIREIGILAVMHEVAHAADGVQAGGKFSADREMKVQLVNGMPMAMRPGTAMDEILTHFEDYDSGLSQLLQYPLDMSDPENRKMSARELREEVFAQVWAFSNTFGGMEWLQDNLPTTAAFLERVNAEIKQTDYGQAGAQQGAQPGQVQDGAAGQGSVQRASRSKAVPASAKEEVGLLTKTLRTAAGAALNKVVFSEDLFKRASDMGLTAAMDMDRIYRERAALTGNIEREVTRIENLYNRIPTAFKGTGPRSANQFLYDSTREAKWGFAPKWRGQAASKVQVDAGMAQRFKALPKEAQEWVRAVLEHGDKMLALKKQTLIESTNSEYDALIADARARGETNKADRLENDKQASLRQFQRLFATSEFNPYAPMRRFGDFVVVAKSKEYMAAQTQAERAKLEKDPDHYHVSFAESRASALELERQLTQQGAFASVTTRAKEDARGDMYGGLMDAFNKLRGNIESELGNATDPEEIASLRAARETVVELYLQSLAENSARKAEMRRRAVAGEIDMLRSFSTQGRADAHFLASAKYNPQAQDAVVKMRQQAKEGGKQLEKSDAFKEILARHTQSMKYENGGWFDVANRASRVTSLWMLATSPMYYLQNLTQPFVLSLPFMTGKHDYSQAAGQLMRSYFQLGALLKSAKLGEGFDFTKVSTDKNEQDMVLKLVDRGRIDIGMDTELGKVKLEGDSTASKLTNRADQFLRSLSQKVEAINRVSTALAAYRLERKGGASHEAALEYADQVIAQTHGDYTRINAPRAFNTPAGKVALQFRKFQLIQLTLLTKLVYNTFKGASPEERAAARKMLAFTLGHTGMLAGVVGMPGFAAAAFIINKLADAFGDDDEPYNLENELRKMLGDGDMARAIMRGAPTLAGTDLSGKLGMGNALSILPYTDFEASREGFNAIATGLTLGATGGLGAKVFEALGNIKDGDYYRGLMGLSPSLLAGGIKAFVEANRGETNRKGDVLVSADEISNWESFAKLIGWPTSAQSERRFDRQVAYDNKEAFENKASKLKNEYSRAVRENDADGRRAAIEKWQRLQTSRREAGFQAQPLSALMKAPQEQAKRERNTSGGVQFDKRNRQFVMEQTQ